MQYYAATEIRNSATGLSAAPESFHAVFKRSEAKGFGEQGLLKTALSYAIPKTPKGLVARALGATAALLLVSQVLPSPDTEVSAWSMSSTEDMGADIVSGTSLEDANIVFCSQDSPVLFEGRHNRFAITNNATCEMLFRALPAPGQTSQLDDRISITAYNQGGMKVTMKVGDDTFVQDVPPEIYRALLEGILTTMDENQTPVSFAPALYMYKQESALGASLRVAPEAGTACGMGMTTIANFAQNLMETGDRVGLGTMRWNALKIEAGMNLRARGRAVTPESEMAEIGRIKSGGGVNYRRLINNPQFRTIFTSRCDDVTPGAILGAQNLAVQTARIQDQIDEGALRLPDGRTHVTLRDAYLRYMLQGNMNRLYSALNTNPNVRLDVLFAADNVYSRNINMFSVRENGRRRPLTAREFYNSIPDRGFDDHYQIDMRGYEPVSHDVGDAFRFASDTPHGERITLTRAESTSAQFQTYARPNIDYVYVTVRGYDWQVANDQDTQTAETASAAPAVR